MSDDPATAVAAQQRQIPVKTCQEVRGEVATKLLLEDTRLVTGQLEVEFGLVGVATSNDKDDSHQCIKTDEEPTDDPDSTVHTEETLVAGEASGANGSGLSPTTSTEAVTGQEPDTKTQLEDSKEPISSTADSIPIKILKMSNSPDLDTHAPATVPSLVLDQASDILHQVMVESAPGPPVEVTFDTDKPRNVSLHGMEVRQHVASESSSEEDSDEEIIVFTPKSKRFSAQASKSTSSPLSLDTPLLERPKTADPKDSSSKLRLTSSLRPESPVFTPVKALHTPMQSLDSALTIPTMAFTAPRRPLSSSPNAQQGTRSPNARKPSTSPRQGTSSPAEHSRSPGSTKGQSHEDVQRQSRDIIQRQRDAIQRASQAVTKAPPRQIQMEPTANPTVIDPDAFDRSYVVQPRSDTTKASNGSHAHGHRLTGSNGSTSRPVTREGPRGNGTQPRSRSSRGSPKARDKIGHASPEADVEFVLKSGASRASLRGKGKLWVP